MERQASIVRIAIGADHAGYELKEFLREQLLADGCQLHNFGTDSGERVDYPDIAVPLTRAVVAGHRGAGARG